MATPISNRIQKYEKDISSPEFKKVLSPLQHIEVSSTLNPLDISGHRVTQCVV